MPTKFPRLGRSRHGTIPLSRLTPRTGPTINRGKGNNNVGTPWKFIYPVEAKFGKLDWDLAASASNAKTNLFIEEATNSLTVDWHKLPVNQSVAGDAKPLCFLNPPFTNITPWARKCAEEVQLGARILLLVPASVGAVWYWTWVVPSADVYSVGRMVFDDCYDKHGKLITDPYPKDLILCHYDWSREAEKAGARTGSSNENYGGLIRWRWQDG